MTTPAAVGFSNSSEREYPPDEWRITGELIRQIGNATTWQRIVEAGDALMTVSRIAKSMRDERDHHNNAENSRRMSTKDWLCLGNHRWTGRGDGETCCPQCGRRPSTEAPAQ